VQWHQLGDGWRGLSGGSAGYGAVWSSSSALTYDSALYVDTTNHRLGIGTTSPATFLDIKGNNVFLRCQLACRRVTLRK